jgi:hypothetical protein
MKHRQQLQVIRIHLALVARQRRQRTNGRNGGGHKLKEDRVKKFAPIRAIRVNPPLPLRERLKNHEG